MTFPLLKYGCVYVSDMTPAAAREAFVRGVGVVGAIVNNHVS